MTHASAIGSTFDGRIVARDDGRRPARDRAGDPRQRLDHRHLAALVDPTRPVPGGLPALRHVGGQRARRSRHDPMNNWGLDPVFPPHPSPSPRSTTVPASAAAAATPNPTPHDVAATIAVLVSAPLVVLVPAIVVAGSLSQSWNGLSFTAAAELAGYVYAERSAIQPGVALALVGHHAGRLRGDRGGDVVGRRVRGGGCGSAGGDGRAARARGGVRGRKYGVRPKLFMGSCLLVEPADAPGVREQVALRERVGRGRR